MKSTFRGSLLLTCLLLGASVAFAQPANAPKGKNPPTRGRQPRPHLSPAQRQQQTENRLRGIMIESGITDKTVQDALFTYLAEELEARKPLRQMGMRLQDALSNPDTTDAQIKGLIEDYKNAQEVEQQRRDQAQADLDAKIHYTQNPRLEGFLMLMGVLGDGGPMMQGQRRSPSERRNNRAGGRGAGGNAERWRQMLQRFDKNGDGKLDDEERAAMQAEHQQRDRKHPHDDKAAPADAPENPAK